MASTPVAYFLWLIGGWCGLHQFYLGRDNHGLLMTCIQPIFLVTLPFWWMAMFRDLFKIPEYVSAANRDPTYVRPRKEAIELGAAPPFNFSRLLAQFFFGAYFQAVGKNLKIPELFFSTEVAAVDIVLMILGSALGVWMVQNCGTEQTPWWTTVGGALLGFCSKAVAEGSEEGYPVFGAIVAAQYFRQYDKTLAPKSRGFTSNTLKVGLLLSIIGFAAITNITVEVNGENVTLREAIKNVLRSDGFKDFTSMLWNFIAKCQEKGFEDAFKEFAEEFKERFDVDGEDHAYKVLGVEKGASLSDIKKAYRKLSLKNHPDKGGSDEAMAEINEAYQTLEKVLKSKEKFKSSRNSGG